MTYETDQNHAAKKPTPPTDQDVDFISLLPDDILHTILSKLETRDAAVTTAVSKRWAPLFPTLPYLKTDFFSFFNHRDPEPDPLSCVDERIIWVNSLISVLDSRKTAIKKFDIEENIRELYADDFYPIFSVVCFAGVEELLIFNTGNHRCYQIPSPVFACNTIVNLDICACSLVVPLEFTGLCSVKSLELTNVIVADDDLQRMISCCKAMEKLSIIECFKVKNTVICAPNLSELVICLHYPLGVVLKCVPRLVSVAISFDSSYNPSVECCYACLEEKGSDDEESDGEEAFDGTNEATNLMVFLNQLGCVKDLRLNFTRDYHKILSKDGMALATRLYPKCNLVELKKLSLCFPFNYNNFNMIISCLLNSSPRLMEIIICVGRYSNDSPAALELNFWKKQLPAECVKHHLKTAAFYLDYFSEDCFGFLKFLLRNAGNLKNMNVFYYGMPKRIPNTAERIKKALSAIQKASPDVEIMVKPIIARHIPSFLNLKSGTFLFW